MVKHKALNVKIINALPAGKHSDGQGLWLHKRDDGGAQWRYRFTLHGKRREMGLGSYASVTLKQAREMAEEARQLVAQGKDPINERAKARSGERPAIHTLAEVIADTFETRKASLKGDGTAGRWMSPLETHIIPKLGSKPVTEIDQIDLRDTLKPIWHTKADVARKALQRVGICLKHAAALGLDVDLQAVMKAKALLGQTRYKAQAYPHIPWQEVPAFYDRLELEMSQVALRLLILTCVRTDAVRHCHLDQIEGDVWTVPAEHVKGAKGKTSDFRVPLSSEAVRAIGTAKEFFVRDGWLFPGVRANVMSNATMSAYMRRNGYSAVPHGFRASFRTWCSDTLAAPADVAEAVLGHVRGSKVERAYDRSDLLERRRPVMENWGGYVTGGAGKIVALAK